MPRSEPLLFITVNAKTEEDERKLRIGLSQLTAEDPTVDVKARESFGSFTIGAIGELHLEIICERLHREFGVQASVGKPQIAYKKMPSGIILEPVMRVEVSGPKPYMADVTAGLLRRRGRIQAAEERSGTHIIQAIVPLSQMFGYASDLRELTQGRAAFTMHFDRYEPYDPPADPDIEVRQPRSSPPSGKSSSSDVPEP